MLIENELYKDLDLYNDVELYQALLQEVESKRVRMFKHNELPLVGFDYTEKCQFDKTWNKVNSIARGLVFEVIDKGNNHFIIQRLNNPLPKFQNLEESKLSLEDIKDQIESITTKEDGSCIITFLYWGIRIFMTRGSFHSPQVQIAESLWPLEISVLDFADCTGIFELVGPSNKNVNRTKYLKDELILICIRNNQKLDNEAPQEFIDNIIFLNNRQVEEVVNNINEGEEYPSFIPNVETTGANRFKQPINYLYSNNLYNEVINNPDPNYEGIVIKLKDGTRYKVKSELYKRLHRVLTGEFTQSRKYDLWESWKNNSLQEQINEIPDEFFSEVRSYIDEVDRQYYKFFLESTYNWQIVYELKQNGFDRKTIAINHPNKVYWLTPIFNDWNKEQIDEYIVKMFKRRYLEE